RAAPPPLSLRDALPICCSPAPRWPPSVTPIAHTAPVQRRRDHGYPDRTRPGDQPPLLQGAQADTEQVLRPGLNRLYQRLQYGLFQLRRQLLTAPAQPGEQPAQGLFGSGCAHAASYLMA